MDRFGASIAAAANGEPIPEDGYHGGYITDLAATVLGEHPEYADLAGDERMEAFREAGYALQLQQHKDVLHLFRTDFDVWYSERYLHDSGAVERGLAAEHVDEGDRRRLRAEEEARLLGLLSGLWLVGECLCCVGCVYTNC